MNKLIFSSLSIALGLSPLQGQAPATTEPKKPTEQVQAGKSDALPSPLKALKQQQEKLAIENALKAEQVKQELATLRNAVQKLKLEKEKLAEEQAIAELNLQKELREHTIQTQKDEALLKRNSILAKAQAEKLASELKTKELESSLATAALVAEMKQYDTEKKHESFTREKPEYLKNPLQEDQILVISDRRISLNGPISYKTADYITERIQFFNNKDASLPIFIVIDTSPGGSVMSGYRILKAMESSSAPIHVVVKSYAASMAATIATLAEHSYAYPNAIILHHQLSASAFGSFNLTEQKEFFEESKKWWDRLSKPLIQKMGYTQEEFIQKMYENSSSGDWAEFADNAKKLKWINHIIQGVRDTSIVQNPDAKNNASKATPKQAHRETADRDEQGRPVQYLPRLYPHDFYFLYNPDNFYRMR